MILTDLSLEKGHHNAQSCCLFDLETAAHTPRCKAPCFLLGKLSCEMKVNVASRIAAIQNLLKYESLEYPRGV